MCFFYLLHAFFVMAYIKMLRVLFWNDLMFVFKLSSFFNMLTANITILTFKESRYAELSVYEIDNSS